MPLWATLSQSQRLGLLSTSLSAWVEGSAGLRNAVLLSLAEVPSSPTAPLDQFHSDDWKTNFLYWFTSPSRELDYTENGVIAGFDLVTALAILKILQIKPLLPFLLTPILATVPLPATFTARSLSKISWTRTVATILVVTLIEEMSKVFLLYSLKLWRRHLAQQRRLRTGKVIARGAPLRLPLEVNDDVEDEIECLICSGLGTEGPDPAAQSVSSISTTNFEPVGPNALNRQDNNGTESDSFGPLEEFCTTAPHKHVAHRQCFLRWVESYRQQQQRIFLEPVNVQFQSHSEGANRIQRWAREEKVRIRLILQTAGFEHILPSLIFPASTAAIADSAPTLQPTRNENAASPDTRRAPGPQFRSSLLTVSSQAPSTSFMSSNQPTTLATLQTSSPSCPACRGPVHILFMREGSLVHSHAGKPSSSTMAMRSSRARRYLRTLARGWWREFLWNVTGRSLLIRLAAQYSFLLVLVSMIKATGRRNVKK